jgi:hypothetical protein
MGDDKLSKARIRNEDTNKEVLECKFNPTDYTFTKGNKWKTDPLKKNDVPMPSFEGGDIMKMKFQLFFDTYGTSKDVREHYTDKLLDLMTIDVIADKKKKTGRPPLVSFHWGEAWSFKGVITSVTLKFTLFEGNGTPVRATADVELQQAVDSKIYPKQNPTSGGDGAQTSRVVQLDETLDLIAYQEYGDPTLWRLLADANNLPNPRSLRPGQRLLVPSPS